MPRKKKPAYLLHKPTGQARVRIDGRDIYLGPYGSEESYAEYDRVIRDWLLRQNPDRSRMTVDELAVRYLEHAERYYRKPDGTPTCIHVVRAALRYLVKISGPSRLEQFGPLRLKAVRESMLADGLARKTINDRIQIVKQAFKWAVENELCPVEIWQALLAVPGLKRGRSEAREPDPILPVAEEHVNAVLPYLNRQVRDMVRLQLLMGCRPTEICILRPCDIEDDGDIWLYRPESHKTEHHGKDRVIFIGPRGQEVLRPWLDRDHNAYCFSPAEAVAELKAEKRRQRKSKVQPSQTDRSKSEPKRKPRERYTKDSYRRAIQRGCEKAGVPKWSPNQLRHSRATTIRKTYGIEAAQITLGHADANVTQIYAERDLERGKQIALEIG